MRKIIYKTIIFISGVLTLLACDTIHQFPDDNPVDPTLVNVTVNIMVSQSSLSEMESEVYPINIDSDQSVKLVVEAYKYDDTETVIQRREVLVEASTIFSSGCNVVMQLNATKYHIVTWVYYVDTNDEGNEKYFSTSNGLRNISLVTPIVANTNNKNCFFGNFDADLTSYINNWNVDITIPVNAEPPVGRYFLVTNDIETYLQSRSDNIDSKSVSRADIEGYYAEIIFEGYVPNGFNAYTGELNDAITGLYYTSNIEVTGDNEAVIAMDYSLAKSLEQAAEGTVLTVTVRIYNADGEMINEQGGVEIALVRGQLTIVTSDFFTRLVTSGVTINPNYDGRYDIVIDDDGNVNYTN
ncbi:MAG: DUF6562 domain-containing protein [Bacteroidales bacterium]